VFNHPERETMNETSTRRKRRSREEWQQLIDAQASSELTPAAFCQANGLSLASFQNWKRRLTAEPPAPVEPWVDLGTFDRPSDSGWDIELDLGNGVCLRLRRC
jgi:putative transposase